MAIAVATILPIVLSVLLRGSLIFSLSGISLQTGRGSTAGHGRSLARALAVWAPILLAGLIMRFGPATSVYARSSVAIAAAAYALALAGAVYSLMFPQRGVQDLTAGTYLVPK
jgi:hypothetical protein